MSPYLSILVVCGIWTAMPQLRDDPIPLRREFAPPPSDSVQRVRMPRQVFEQLVQRAATNQERPPARIATAAYRATLTADGLTGSADWSLVGEPNQSIRFDEWRIAINKPRGGAILDASGLTLTQPQPTLQFDWSTRGIEEPSQLRIALEFPAAPIATLELDLPHDRIPHVSAGLLSGPVPFNATRSRWRLAFGGIPKVELTLARPTAPTSRPFTIGTRRTRYDFSPGIAMIASEFDLAVFREPITQWECELPPNLSLLTVTGPQVARWRIEATKLVVDFRELNTTTTKLSIQGVSPTPTDGQPWKAPRLEPTSMSLTADSIDVTVPSDLVVESVVAPDYRLVRTTSTAERGMTSNYVATLANDTPIRRRSLQFKLRVSPVEFRVHESLDWQLDGTRQQLVGRFKVTVVRGLVARLLVAIPPGFTPLNASMTPADPALTWQPHGTDHWLFEPSRPLNAGETYDIRIDLRKPPPKLQRQSLPVPPLSIVGAAEQHGEYRVTVSTPFRGTIPGEVTDNDGTIWLNTKTVNRSALALDLPSEPVSPSTSIPSARPVPEWLLNDVQQTTSIDADRQRTVTLTGRIVSSVSPRMTVQLPAEASVDFAMMNGKYADPLVSKFDSHTQVTITVPSIRDGVTFRLQYRLPSVSGLWPDVSRDSPKLPGDPPILHLWSAPTFRIWPLVANTMAERIRLIPTSHVDIVSWSLGVLIGAGIVAFVRYIWRRRGLQVGIVAGVIGSTVLGSPAQAPAPITVYCTREHNTSIVYVPQSVLDRLQSIATPLAPVVRWTSAEYRGVAHDTTVSFDAQWTIELGRSGTQNINLPLTGVRLESLTLDGRRAFPIAAANETYTLTVEGVGVHQVSAKFIVPAVAVGNDREFRFGIPAIPTATLRFVGPTIGRVRALERLGILHDGGPETRVELGAVTTIALRWRASREFLGGPAVSVREANVWEITESSLRLTTALLYRVDRGTLSRVAIEIPPGVEPGRIVVRPLDQGSVKSSVTSSVNGVRGWRFTPSAENWQRLQIELQAPTDGRFVVVLECVPRGVFGSRPSLCVPRSLDSLGTTCDIGVRVGGVMVERWENQGVIDYPADAVVRDWIDVPELPLDAPLTRSFRREGSGIPLTRPTLRVGGS